MEEQQEQVCIVSGGSRGLGAQLVRRFLDENYKVAAFSRSPSDFTRSLAESDPDGQRFYWESVDSTDHEAIRRFTRTVIARFGRIDVLVNNAATGNDGLFPMMRSSDICNLIDVNLTATTLLTQFCVKQMFRQQSGAVVSIASVNAVRGHAGVAVYSATKSALYGLTRSLARELGSRNIRLNVVSPGYFESEMVQDLTEEQRRRIARRTPLGRLARIEEIVEAIYFLASPAASFITGQEIIVDGGITC